MKKQTPHLSLRIKRVQLYHIVLYGIFTDVAAEEAVVDGAMKPGSLAYNEYS